MATVVFVSSCILLVGIILKGNSTMDNFLQSALDWSEVWALLIPLAVIVLFKRKRPAFLKPVVIYVWLALVIDLIIDFIWVFKRYFPVWLQSNNPYYNIHAVVRFACFSIFFLMLPQGSYVKLRKILVIVSVAFCLINFVFFENFFNPDHLSGNLLAAEAYLLLIYCMQYYLAELKNDSPSIFNGPDFWVVTGLSIYVAISFFVFLFYLPMLQIDDVLSDRMWNFHNVAFIIFCIFLTKALYGPFRNKHSV